MPKIKSLEIKGFRAYGIQAQQIDFEGLLTLVWAPNSQGKTSLAEAIEFLLTGKTVRREMIASAKREFAEALRNAHLPQTEEVYVAAHIEDETGCVHYVKRRLVRDYTGRDPCLSELEVDGKPADNLKAIGIHLSQPPLEAPVLMPHTLRYVISTQPQERTEYFKALLEVSDLEEIRDAIAQAKNRLAEPAYEVSALYESCRSHPTFGNELAFLESIQPTEGVVEEALNKALARVLIEHGDVHDGIDARLAVAKELLNRRRVQTFPIGDLLPTNQPSWGARPEVEPTLSAFLRAKDAVDKEVARLLRLFHEVLSLVEGVESAVDCPVCETPLALTPHRLRAIREKVEASTDYTKHRREANQVLSNLISIAQNAIQEANRACPPAVTWQEQDRARYMPALEELLDDRVKTIVSEWESVLADLKQAKENIKRKATSLKETIASLQIDDLNESIVKHLGQKAKQLFAASSEFDNALEAYKHTTEPLIETLKQEVDRRAGMEGWQDLINLCESRESLLGWLIERFAYQQVRIDIDEAISDIDAAKAEVLDDKFSELGQEILRWWNLLRPGEPTSFYGVERGGSGRRFIDLKARLGHPGTADSQGVLRDAVAIFSDSQLNALGLAAFLARTVREGNGFVVLDDPVPATDREHRAFFINNVLNELIGEGIQVILLTHDEQMRKDVEELYAHVGLDSFTITMGNPIQGSFIKKNRDTLDSKLKLADQYLSSQDAESLKNAARTLRDAAERFCKLMLVQERRKNGERSALVTDYDGKTLGQLRPMVEPLLTNNTSHPGKLRVIVQRLNPGSHDHEVPPIGDLKQCLGDLKALRKEYLP